MTDLATHLERLGLELYLDAFVAEGFDSWETLLDIQESDLDALGVKLGHRRKLQRAIADYRGISYERLLDPKQVEGSAGESSTIEGQQQEGSSNSIQGGSAPPQEQKRKYRRHPKQDENAPEKPPSAYVLFSNKTREDVKAEQLSFTEIAKLVGERWQKLDPPEKEPYESHAQALKEAYHIQLSAYKKTESYRNYMQYLAEFKLKHGQANDNKRPKLDPQSSGGSLSTTSLELSESVTPGPTHVRGGSLEAGNTGSHAGALPSLPSPTALAPTISLPNLSTASSGGFSAVPAPHTGSPPSSQFGPDPRRMGPLSTQTSLSDESGQPRNDLQDPLSRTATLSLNTPPAVTSPLPPTIPAASRLDQSGGPESFTWSVPRQPPQASSLSSPRGPGLAFQPQVANDPWRDRVPDSHRQSQPPAGGHGGYPPPLTLAPIIAPDRLPDLTRVQAQRILPPLQRQYSSVSSPHTAYPPQHVVQAQGQNTPRPLQPVEYNDSEAATTLAALAKRSTDEQISRPGDNTRS